MAHGLILLILIVLNTIKQVVCNLEVLNANFSKELSNPIIRQKKIFENNADYYLACRSITYNVAHKDIKEQKERGVKGEKYIIEGIRYFDRSKKKPSYFIESAPEEIKNLANNLNDKTNPLWDVALKYTNEDYINFDNYGYKIIRIREI